MGRKGKKIVGFNVGRENIRVFESAKEASEWLGLCRENIVASLKNNYMGTLDGWEFFYYDNFFNTDYYSSPDKARKIGLYKLECFRDATERRGIYIGEKIHLQDYVNNYLKSFCILLKCIRELQMSGRRFSWRISDSDGSVFEHAPCGY